MSSFMHSVEPSASLRAAALSRDTRLQLPALYVWSVPLAAVVGSMKGLRIGGLEYTGFLWLGYVAMGWFLLLSLIATRRTTRPAMPTAVWSLWLMVVWGSLCWGEHGWRNVQDALQISLPILVGVVASIANRSAADLQKLLQSCWLAIAGIGAVFVVTKLGIVKALGLETDIRACALTLALFGAFAIAAIPQQWIMPLVGWASCIVLTFITGGRLATAALLLSPVLHPRMKSIGLRLTCFAVLLVMGIGFFYTPVFQKRFFAEGKGTLTQLVQGDFLWFGRFETWPSIFEEAQKHPWLGAGVGSTRNFVPTVWENVTLPHNDYLRIFFEEGALGVAVFLLAVVWQIVDLRRQMRQTHGIVRYAFGAVLLGWCMFLLAACTDNPLSYAIWVTNPLFALMGAAYGVAKREARDVASSEAVVDVRSRDDALAFTLYTAPEPLNPVNEGLR